ncbi:hypothetical protein AB6A40_000063 [Gnathostoma spinigerum]|uniref:Rhodanese domain-containing protein n=1 Tax=Gnathostoma spinigerum TaxID=75299 RepID=A0ABD6E7K0_9BILA
MILLGEDYPSINVDQLVSVLIEEKTNKKSPILILDTRSDEEYDEQHIIGAQHYNKALLIRERYATKAMLDAKRDNTQILVYGCRLTAGDVTSTLNQRGFNAALLRGDMEYWQKKYPVIFTRSSGDVTLDVQRLSAQYEENKRPSIEKYNFRRGTSSSQNKTIRPNERTQKEAKYPQRRAWR